MPLWEKTMIAGIFEKERISAFTFLSTFYEDCFLLKTAIAVALKKSNKRENTVFLRATAEQSRFFTGKESI